MIYLFLIIFERSYPLLQKYFLGVSAQASLEVAKIVFLKN